MVFISLTKLYIDPSRSLINLGPFFIKNLLYKFFCSWLFKYFSNASVIFNSASVSGLSSGGGATVNSNLLYNGAMQVHQRIAVSASATNINNYGDYISGDRWYSEVPYLQPYGTVAQSIENDAPTGSGFRKSLRHAYSGSDVISGSKYMLISH